MSDKIGQRFGDYRLLRFLGDGTFGDVYLAEHMYQKTPAAVKVFKTKLTLDKLKKFLIEVRTVLLRHPHIVPIIDFGIRDDDIAYLVMAYASNGTLLARHPRGTRLPLPTIVTYVKQIAAALQYAHNQRLIHRDLKPANVLCGANNELLLSDFGLVVVAHTASSQQTEDIGGSPAYMAPDQWKGKPLPASDQYALGIIVYEWLCGELPFQGNNMQLMYQHTQVPPPSLHRKNLAIPLDVERAVMKTLEKEPKERFASVQAFAEALEEISKELPIGTTLCTYRGHVGRENSVVWLPDGSYIINPGNVGWVTSVAWSPDGKYVASASRDGTVQIWEALTGNQRLTYRGHSGNVNSVAWAPDGTYIASAGTDETVHVWTTITGNNCLTYRGHSSQVNAVAWSHYGKHIASASSDETVQIWDALTGQRLLVCQNTEAMKEEYWDEEDTENGEEPDEDTVEDVAWSPDDSHFASASYYRGIQVFNALTGIILCTYSPASCVDWAPDGKRVVCDGHKYRMDYEDGEIYPHDPIAKVLDATTGHVLTTYDGHDVQAYGGLFVSTVAWSPNGIHIASSDHTRSVHIWKATTGDKVFTYHGHSDNIRTLAWSPDGTYIASGSSDGIIQVWQARELAKFP